MARSTPPRSPVFGSPVFGTSREERVAPSQKEVLRWKEENLSLSLSKEELVKRLVIEKINLSSFRGHIQDRIKKAVPSDTSSPPNEVPLSDAFLTQCDVARLEAEKESLEYKLKEQNRKIESLVSELEYQKKANTNRSADEQLRTKLFLLEQQLEETKFNCLKLKTDNERQKDRLYKTEELELKIIALEATNQKQEDQLLLLSCGTVELDRERQDLLTRITLLENENECIRKEMPQKESRRGTDKKRITQNTLNLAADDKPVKGREFGIMELEEPPQDPKPLRSDTEIPPRKPTESEPSRHRLKTKLEPRDELKYNMYNDLTPPIFPIPNPTSKSPRRIHFRAPIILSVIKLKSLCGFKEQCPIKQVVCLINRRYELGLLMGVFELEINLGLKCSISHYGGIALYNPVGESDGEFRGTRLFQCEENCAIFIPYDEVLVPVM